MLAKAAGMVVGKLVMVIWFWLAGARPVMETVLRLPLGLAGGLFAWRPTERGFGWHGSDKS